MELERLRGLRALGFFQEEVGDLAERRPLNAGRRVASSSSSRSIASAFALDLASRCCLPRKVV